MVKQAKKSKSAKNWDESWSVAVKVFVERNGLTVLEQRVADLMVALQRTNSISAAARLIGISYRHAWLLIQEANTNAGQAIIETATGGKQGGGTHVTDHGSSALNIYQKLNHHVRDSAAKSLSSLISTRDSEVAVVHVSAAISLQEALSQIVAEYALVRPTVKIRTIYGASNELADQITAGNSTNVFISASSTHIADLTKRKLVQARDRRVLASNQLAIVANQEFTSTMRKPADLISTDCVIVVADPACPLGRCTERYLQDAKLLDRLAPRLKTGENSRAVISTLRTPGAKVGIIFESDIANAHDCKRLLRIDEKQASTDYEAAIISENHNAESRAFLEFLTGAAAQACFVRCGFTVAKS